MRCVLLLLPIVLWAGETYRKPPQPILDVLNAPETPTVVVSPARDYALLLQGIRYPPMAEVAQPMLRLAGLRINPATNGRRLAPYYASVIVKRLPGGAETPVALPRGARAGTPVFNPDGKRIAFEVTTPSGIELWVADAATAQARRMEGVRLNAAYGTPLAWLPDGRTLRVQLMPARGKPPVAPSAPAGPNVQESYGKGTRVRTFEDLLENPHDENLFDYYATAQLALIDTGTGKTTPVGRPGIFHVALPSPDGRHMLVERIHRPYSYLYPVNFFARDIEIWSAAGKLEKSLATLPLAEHVPSEGVRTGPRECHWQPTAPATVVWVEALDGGDPKNKVPHRDRLMSLAAPFQETPRELLKTEHRTTTVRWIEHGKLALVSEFNIARRWSRTFLVDGTSEPRLVWSRDVRDAYKHPGLPMTRVQANGQPAVIENGGRIYLTGEGASPQGSRPFLDRLDLATLKTERLFQSGANDLESVVALLAADGSRLLTSRQSQTEPLNYYLRPEGKPFTVFRDPAPQLRAITKQRVTYKRADGVNLSFTLYLPPGYRKGTRLPTLVWAYPLEYEDAATAGQITGSTNRFTTIAGTSHLFLALHGYAVLDGATMPVVGNADVVNDTYVDQIVSSAKAAIDKAAEMGVTDPDRVGVGGHSYGAFMTANLMAHSRLFRAGIARSGAYNRTLTPFGFQSERRTIWEAPQTYMKMSPFFFADKIKDPLLMIHGEADDNSGTFPIQSERMYQAVRGNGGNVRLVMLPHEAHAYRARETVEHVLWEMITWFDKYVKDAPPR